MSNDLSAAASRRLVCWEDLVDTPPRRYGPVVCSSQLLDQLLDLLGEKHPVHGNDAFAQLTARKRRIVPAGFIHSITSGWVVQHGAPAAVIGLRSVTWDFIRPLYPDVPFFFSNQTVSATPVDETRGILNTERRVFDEDEQVYAIGRMNVVILRRAALRAYAQKLSDPQQASATSEEGLHGR